MKSLVSIFTVACFFITLLEIPITECRPKKPKKHGRSTTTTTTTQQPPSKNATLQDATIPQAVSIINSLSSFEKGWLLQSPNLHKDVVPLIAKRRPVLIKDFQNLDSKAVSSLTSELGLGAKVTTGGGSPFRRISSSSGLGSRIGGASFGNRGPTLSDPSQFGRIGGAPRFQPAPVPTQRPDYSVDQVLACYASGAVNCPAFSTASPPPFNPTPTAYTPPKILPTFPPLKKG